ncbi:MAG: M14 family metallopeptidase [Candidatus Sericytochromatia bacterium]
MKKIYFIVIIFIVFFPFISYSKDNKDIIDKLYSYKRLEIELNDLSTQNTNFVSLETICKTFENKNIYLARISNKLIKKTKSSVLAIFAQHGDEHDTTLIAMNLIKNLINNKDKILDTIEVCIIPMVNPDGADFDLLNNSYNNFMWRKNRIKVDDETFGVDLNRNWGFHWDEKVSIELEKNSNNKKSSYYKGLQAFSENETKSIRDFLINNKNIKVFLDYHSGISDFNQGMIIIPYTYTEQKIINENVEVKYKKFVDRFKSLISNNSDKRGDFISIQVKDIPNYLVNEIKKKVPPTHLPKVIESLPKSMLSPGSSIDYVYGELGILSLGLEISREKNFYDEYNQNNKVNFENQLRGFMFILDYVKNN